MDAEQPDERRTAALLTRSSHPLSIFTPYLALTVAEGKLSKVHMPSSASAVAPAKLRAAVAATAIDSFMERPVFGGKELQLRWRDPPHRPPRVKSKRPELDPLCGAP